MHDSIWRSSVKSLLKSFCAVVGIFLAFIPMILFFNAIDTTEDSIPNDYTAKILPNANGVRKKLSKSAPVILQLDIQGIIGATELTQKTVENILIESRENSLKPDRVKGILLIINSPGGTMNDADGIYKAIASYKERYKVPVYAYVDGLCASGGMYVACAADQIYASDVSLIGSIGVIAPSFLNMTKLMDKIGVDALTISAGKGKDELNPLRPWKPDEDKNIKEIIQYYYSSFVDLVTKHRPKVDRTALVNEYGARVFPAVKSAEIGLIDHSNATREVALKNLLAKLGIEDEYYQVIRMESTSWLNQLFNTESPLITGKVKHELLLDGALPAELLNQPLFLYRQ